jgi:hypothetical protein
MGVAEDLRIPVKPSRESGLCRPPIPVEYK